MKQNLINILIICLADIELDPYIKTTKLRLYKEAIERLDF
jgi:hypothetical protein